MLRFKILKRFVLPCLHEKVLSGMQYVCAGWLPLHPKMLWPQHNHLPDRLCHHHWL